MKSKKQVRIFLTGDMSTDYRMHKSALSLVEMGFDVEVVCRRRRDYKTASSDIYRIVYLSTLFEKGALFYLVFNLRIFLYLLCRSTKIALAVDLDTLPGVVLASRIKAIPVVFDSHEYFPEVPELQSRAFVRKIWIFLEQIFVPKIARGITVCKSIADIYKQKYGLLFEVVRNLPSAQRMNEVQPLIIDNRFKIVYQGAVNLGRGLKETIEALPMLDNVVLIVIGDGDMMSEIRQLVSDRDLSEKVVFIGKIPFYQLSGYTASADVGLCLLENLGLNYYYSLPNRIFDFALAGKPVLASNFPEIRNVVANFETGLLVDDLKPGTIANAINQLKNYPQEYEVMCKNAKNVGKILTWENEMPVLEKVYADFI